MVKKAKVKRNSDMISATRMGEQPVLSTVVSDSTGLPTLSESIQMREMQKAQGLGPQEVASAKGLRLGSQEAAGSLGSVPSARLSDALKESERLTSQSLKSSSLKPVSKGTRKASIKRNKPQQGDDVYDPSIGYGASAGKSESGRAAVERIKKERKAKVKRNKK